jgi:hypothetical protein
LAIECLEQRTLPASVFVVPLSVAEDASHFHGIAEAVAAAGTAGLVTIEPGTDASGPFVGVMVDRVTIQGDPNFEPSSLAAYTLALVANGITLTRMHLGSVLFASGFAQFTTISHCLISGGVEPGGSVLPQQPLISHNLFDKGSFLSVGGDDADARILDNVFYDAPVSLATNGNTIVRGNQFTGDQSFMAPAVSILDYGNRGSPDVIEDNQFLLSGPNTVAIDIEGIGNSDQTIDLLNNRIFTDYVGTGVKIHTGNGNTAEQIRIQGNDFQGNLIGVSIIATVAAPNFEVDLGGGLSGSLGANDFRGYTAGAPLASAAISLSTLASVTLSAKDNIFSLGVDPTTLIDDATHGSHTGAGTIDLGSPLSQGEAFVQTLYDHVLRRTGSLDELTPWVNVLAQSGQLTVVDGILYSPESLGRSVDDLYTRLLDRDADPIGRNDWIGFLATGGSVEEVEQIFVTSPEYLSKNANWPRSLYHNILSRAGTDQEISDWSNAISTIGFSAIAVAFTHSTEASYVETTSIYRRFLHRTPAQAEAALVVGMPLNLLGIDHFVLGSPEYFANG